MAVQMQGGETFACKDVVTVVRRQGGRQGSTRQRLPLALTLTPFAATPSP